jgi:DNA-binding transcriptional MerR regulator
MKSTQAADHPGEKLYTLGTVSKLTGVGAITLRAWERRYGLITPVRKDSGHRLYTRGHIDQINRITALTHKGMRISQIRPEMLASEAAAVEGGPDADLAGLSERHAGGDHRLRRGALEEIYNEALSLYPIGLVTRKLLTPLLIELGLRWEGRGGRCDRRGTFLRLLPAQQAGRALPPPPPGSQGPAGAPRMLLAGLPGEHHEFGSTVVRPGGARVRLPRTAAGANMPLAGLAAVARKKHCAAIVLTGAIEPSKETLARGLPELVARSPVPVLVGGLSRSTPAAIGRAGAEALGRDIEHGLQRLREVLSR